MENNYTVYMHIFPNNKVYIGITNKNVNSRWRKNGVGYTNCPRMNNAINKYGWENVEHKILYEYSYYVDFYTLSYYNKFDLQRFINTQQIF